MTIKLEVEETIAAVADPNNGAGPMWCYGSRTIAREGDAVFAVVPEIGAGVKPLCNTRWQLFRRPDAGAWERVQANASFDEREPCPLVRLPGQRLMLSTHPATGVRAEMKDGRLAHHCEPRLLTFDAGAPERPPVVSVPGWGRNWPFTEHSYRGFAADRLTGSWMLSEQVPVGREYWHAWTLTEGGTERSFRGLLRFPMRACYQQLALRGRAAWVMGVSDELDPNVAWREHKRSVTGLEWDYEFRQLFLTWTPDITTTDFSPPLTVASRDETAGLIHNLDLWIDPVGDAHVLYVDRNVWHAHLRNRFFPGMPITVALKRARIRGGRVVERETVFESVEDVGRPAAAAPANAMMAPAAAMNGPCPVWAAFHATPAGRLYAVWTQSEGKGPENMSMCVRPVWPVSGPVERLPVAEPLTRFGGACERNGCDPSLVADIYGSPARGGSVRYLRIRFEDDGCCACSSAGGPAAKCSCA